MLSSLFRLGSLAGRLERAAAHNVAGQGPADNVLGQARDLDQALDVEPGLNAHILAQEGEVLGADVAGRAVGCGERAAAEAGDRGVQLGPAQAEPGIGACPSGVALGLAVPSDL